MLSDRDLKIIRGILRQARWRIAHPDAPLLPHQLKRIARRPALGLGRMGSFAGNGSGDIFIAFSIHHVYSAVLVSIEEKNGLLESIVTGYKYIPEWELRQDECAGQPSARQGR